MTWLTGGLLAGGVLFAVGILFHLVLSRMSPDLQRVYARRELFRPWDGWTRWYMYAHPFLYGFVFAGVFLATGLSGPRGGLLYGLAMFAAGSLPVYALNYASFQVPVAVILAWVAQSLCQYALAGLALGWYVG